MGEAKLFFGKFLVFIIAGFFAASYTLNHFYVTGGYMLDSGWFAFLSAHSVSWPMSNPPSIGGTYFSTHFSPFFYIFTALHALLIVLGVNVPDVSWFSIIQGFWLGLAALSVFTLLSSNSQSSLRGNFAVAATSIVVAFNGVFLASIGFPHFEIAIPSLLLAFFASHISGKNKTALVCLCLGLLVREDAGLHYFGLFFLIAGYLYLTKGLVYSVEVRFYSLLSIFCFAYSLLVILMQKIYFDFGDNALVRVYLGDPVFSHVSLSFVQERLEYFLRNRLYIIFPLLLIVFLSIYKKSWELLIGVVAVLPWIIFSFLAVSFSAGTLASYYSFPVAIALFWPSIAYSLFSRQKLGSLIESGLSVRSIFLIALSSLVFYAGSDGNHDSHPWMNFWPKWIGQIDPVHRSLNDFIQANDEVSIIFDDSVASLLNSTATPSQWKYQLAFSVDELKLSDAVLFQPGSWLADSVKELALAAGFRHLCHISDSRFLVLSRSANLKKCHASNSMGEGYIDTMEETFDYLPGWSHKENFGRWTIGAEVALPVMKVYSYEELCFKGRGYLPLSSSVILAEVYFEGALLGSFVYDNFSPDGERCISVSSISSGDSQDSTMNLKLAGYSSPLSHGLSPDNRLLGMFVEKIYLK